MGENKIPRPGQKANYLTLVVGRDKDQVLVRMKDRGIVIGRSTGGSSVDVDTKPYDGAKLGVSREHVLIAPKKDYFYVQDLETINSTWHNKVRMRPMVAEELYHGDLLHLGELRIEVRYTYEDEVQESLGATVDFGGGAPQTRDFSQNNDIESGKSNRISGEEKPRADEENKTGDLAE